MGWGNESLFKRSWSHDQDGRHAHICQKTFKNLLLRYQKADDFKTWYAASGDRVLPRCSKYYPGLTTYFTALSNFVPYAFVWEKGKTMDFSETIGVYDLKLASDDRSDKNFC